MDKKFVLYVMNDTHYVSKKMWEEGEPITSRERSDCVVIKDTPEILNTFFDKILDDPESDAVLIVGDLVNWGDQTSHEDFRNELVRLKDAGKRVFVTWATHDYNGEGRDENEWNHAVRYTAEGTEPAPFFYKDELFDFYKDFGPGEADSVHEGSGSYTVPLAGGLRLVAIVDNGNGRSHCGLFDDGHAWLGDVLAKARENGETALCCVHHPVLPPWPLYQRVADFEMYGGYAELREILCEYGAKIIFTGHTHVQGIRRFESERGGYFYDVATAALSAAYGQMRRVVYDSGTKVCDVKSVGIEKIKGVDHGMLTAQDYLYRLNFTGLIETAFPYANRKNWDKFIEMTRNAPMANLFAEHKIIARFAMRKLGITTLSPLAKIAGRRAALTKDEKAAAKEKYLCEVVFVVMRHVFRGNAPYTPDTVEYRVVMGLVNRVVSAAEKVGVDTYKLMKELTPEELVAPFLSAAARCGDDDNLTVRFD